MVYFTDLCIELIRSGVWRSVCCIFNCFSEGKQALWQPLDHEVGFSVVKSYVVYLRK